MENLELKSKISEMKSALHSPESRLEMAVERVVNVKRDQQTLSNPKHKKKKYF